METQERKPGASFKIFTKKEDGNFDGPVIELASRTSVLKIIKSRWNPTARFTEDKKSEMTILQWRIDGKEFDILKVTGPKAMRPLMCLELLANKNNKTLHFENGRIKEVTLETPETPTTEVTNANNS